MADVAPCVSFSDLSKRFEADAESIYGQAHPSRQVVINARRVVVKVRHICPQSTGNAALCIILGRNVAEVTYACAAGCGQLVVQWAHRQEGKTCRGTVRQLGKAIWQCCQNLLAKQDLQ